MNDLQLLFRMRGMSMRQLAAAIGEGYHQTQKTIKGVRRQRSIQAAVSAHLGLTVDECFGTRSSLHLKPLIDREINKKHEEYAEKLRAQYLPDTIAGAAKAVNG
jgi:hypothetical protein